jgi:exoribonuclease R
MAASAFILHIGNREYTSWELIPVEKQKNMPAPTISPLNAQFFHNDVIDARGALVRSPYREKEDICGVLLTSEKTYGRLAMNKTGKLLYKCVPDDIHLPCFLIPYEEKNLGFSKRKLDKYITFSVKEWIKHPIGSITETFGDVEDKEAYVAYQMACKEINDSIKQLNAVTLRVLRENTLQPVPFMMGGKVIEDRRSYPIISIDPAGCNDIDDALGIQQVGNTTLLSIYISNVPLMLEYLKLWPVLSNRIATLYLPNKKIPMLPVALSENVCSLREKTVRLALVLDVSVRGKQIHEVQCKPVLIQVEKNYAYEDPELLRRADYKHIWQTVHELNNTQTRKIKNLKYVDKMTTSHEVVEYCMLLMNHECAKLLEQAQVGIFRAATKQPFEASASEAASEAAASEAASEADYEDLPYELKQILQNVAGEYCLYENRKPHDLIAGGLDIYTHVTSPIRRLVDCVNMYHLQANDFNWSAEARSFLQKWETLQGVASINLKSRSIRRLQTQMEMFEVYEQNENQLYTGIVFAKTAVAAVTGEKTYKYKAYIKSLKLLTSLISTKNLPDYSTVDFSVHLFHDEAKMSKKIRLQLL